MPIWNTEKIIKDLTAKFPDIKKINNNGQGGDYDTDTLVIKVNGTRDSLFVCGFTPDVHCDDPSNADVEIVAITDGLDSRGGLNSNSENLAKVFVQVRKYFETKKFETANSIDEYF